MKKITKEEALNMLPEVNKIDFSNLPHMTAEGLTVLRYGAKEMREKAAEVISQISSKGSDAVEFAEWADDNYTRVYSKALNKHAWIYTKLEGILVNGSDLYYMNMVNNNGLSTRELYDLYLQSLTSKP